MSVKVIVVESRRLGGDCATVVGSDGQRLLFVTPTTPLLVALESWQALRPTEVSEIVMRLPAA